jgi:hypothetical protein
MKKRRSLGEGHQYQDLFSFIELKKSFQSGVALRLHSRTTQRTALAKARLDPQSKTLRDVGRPSLTTEVNAATELLQEFSQGMSPVCAIGVTSVFL